MTTTRMAESNSRSKSMKSVRILMILIALITSIGYAQAPRSASPIRPEAPARQPPSRTSLDWLSIVGLVVGVFGAVGTVYTILSWRRSEQDRRVLQYLFNTAEKNLQKDITEAEIQQKRQEASKITAEIHDLQKRLSERIPIEARRAVLLDKLFSQEMLVAQTYSAIQEIRDELGSEVPPSQISPELASLIENEIRPEYILREQRSHLKNQLTIVTTAAAILSAVLPDPIGPLVSIPLFLFAVPVVLKLYRSYLPNDPVGRKRYIYRIAYMGSFWGLIGALLYLASISWRGFPRDERGGYFAMAALVAVAFILCGLFFLVLSRRVSRMSGVPRERPAADHPE